MGTSFADYLGGFTAGSPTINKDYVFVFRDYEGRYVSMEIFGEVGVGISVGIQCVKLEL